MSPRLTALAFVSLIAASLVALAVSADPPPEVADGPPPPVQFVGHDSRIQAPRYVLVKDDEAWARLWSEHTGVEASFVPPHRHHAPKIDFRRFVVVGYFAGASTNTDGEQAVSVSAERGTTLVRYQPSTFQSASDGPERDPGVRTTPFGLWVIERSPQAIVILEGRRGIKSAPVKWTEVHRFDAE
ncbi:MAG: hypothetical protein IBJ11_12515 [Phycisphaerales bacterium]|nr:hypothetical protein [Phycisphaerales bacterium]